MSRCLARSILYTMKDAGITHACDRRKRFFNFDLFQCIDDSKRSVMRLPARLSKLLILDVVAKIRSSPSHSACHVPWKIRFFVFIDNYVSRNSMLMQRNSSKNDLLVIFVAEQVESSNESCTESGDRNVVLLIVLPGSPPCQSWNLEKKVMWSLRPSTEFRTISHIIFQIARRGEEILIFSFFNLIWI